MSVAPSHDRTALQSPSSPPSCAVRGPTDTAACQPASRAVALLSGLCQLHKVTPAQVPRTAVASAVPRSLDAARSQPDAATQRLRLTFYQAFGVLGVPLLALLVVSITWTTWLVWLTLAPNEAANFLMNTSDYDNGQFWLIVERGAVIKWLSTAGLVLVDACYVAVLVEVLAFRRLAARTSEGKDESRASSACCALLDWWLARCPLKLRSRLQIIRAFWSSLTGYNAKNRKFFNLLHKTTDLIVQSFVLQRMLSQGLPDALVFGYACFVSLSSLSSAVNVLVRRYSAFVEVLLDSAFDFVAAVLYPVVVLGYCSSHFNFDRAVYLVNAEVLPDGNFERFARMLADPAEVALFLLNFDSLRIQGALDFSVSIGMNLSFCYRFSRVASVIAKQRYRILSARQQQASGQTLVVATPARPSQTPVPRWLALPFLATSAFVAAYTHEAVVNSRAACAAYPECVAFAHVCKTGGLCPCLMLIDGDRAPREQDWDFPPDATKNVRALATAGTLQGLQLINRQLRHWPEELRHCSDLKTISLIYTSTEEIPSWAKEFKRLQYIHVEGKFGSRNLESLPPDLFSDLPSLTFLHLGNHHHLANIPAFDGTPRLSSLTLAVLLSLVQLPSFENLQWLETMALPHIPLVVALPDMAPLRRLSRFAVFRPNHLCCNGFLGVCDLDDAFCLPDPIFGLPAASCLEQGNPRRATAATLQVFKRFAAAACQKSPVPFALEALSDFPSPERVASCGGVLFRQCEIPGVTSANGTLGMCYSSRMQVVACNVDQFFIQVRRVQIQRGVGQVCDPQEEAWLGCK